MMPPDNAQEEIIALRQKIDALDHELVSLFEKRLRLVQQIGKLKKDTGPHKARFDREADMIFPLSEKAQYLADSQIHYLFRHIINTFLSTEGTFSVCPILCPEPFQWAVQKATLLSFGFLTNPPISPEEGLEALQKKKCSALVVPDPRCPFFQTTHQKEQALSLLQQTFNPLCQQHNPYTSLIHYHLTFEEHRLPSLFILSLPTGESQDNKTTLWLSQGQLIENPTPPSQKACLLGHFRPTLPLPS